MGTNYYLRRKCEFNPLHRLPASLGCDDGHEYEPVELVNGWLLHNKYYPTLEVLNSEYYQELHIGKSSMGWRFLLCTYPKEHPNYHEEYLPKAILSLDDWIELFNDPKNKIFDEYDNEVSKEEMLDIIAHRAPNKGLKEGWQHLETLHDDGITKEEYYVIKGLLVHKMTRPRSAYLDLKRDRYTTIMPDDCTYDLCVSGNDVEVCEIFS